MMRMILAIMFLVVISTMACGPSAMPMESESSTNPQQPEESGPALLLSEESAISILQTFLQECVLSWDDAYKDQQTSKDTMRRQAASYSRMLGTVVPTYTPRPLDQYRLPQSEQEKKSWLTDLATGTTGDTVWSASYHGVTDVPNQYNPNRTAIEAETWVVIGPGLERTGDQLVSPGRWQVYAGHQRAYYLDAPARLALEEYDSYDSCP